MCSGWIDTLFSSFSLTGSRGALQGSIWPGEGRWGEDSWTGQREHAALSGEHRSIVGLPSHYNLLYWATVEVNESITSLLLERNYEILPFSFSPALFLLLHLSSLLHSLLLILSSPSFSPPLVSSSPPLLSYPPPSTPPLLPPGWRKLSDVEKLPWAHWYDCRGWILQLHSLLPALPALQHRQGEMWATIPWVQAGAASTRYDLHSHTGPGMYNVVRSDHTRIWHCSHILEIRYSQTHNPILSWYP